MSIKRALLSVSDKTGLVDFARDLQALGIEILSTGGTAKLLAEHQIPVVEVSDYTGFPEMMGGRLKTLHPKIHGGLLGRRGQDDAAMDAHGIAPIDLVVVNLYPFAETIAKDGVALADAIEQIDIGGPTMLRAAAKNHASVGVVVNSADYPKISAEIKANQSLSDETRFDLAVKTFNHTAAYDGAISNYLSALVFGTDGISSANFPETFNQQWQKKQNLRYGENPHQSAAFYTEPRGADGQATLAHAEQIQGKELSYNNLADADTALECVKSFDAPACVIVKHANPCGVAVGEDIQSAYKLAFATDPSSAFGGIIAFNRALDMRTAEAILERQFVEVIVVPRLDAGAKKTLAKKANVRVLVSGFWQDKYTGVQYKRISGGLLVQGCDLANVSVNDLQIVTKLAPTNAQIRDLLFVWKVAKFVKSNAIVYGKNQQTIGIGAGQMSRVYSAKIAGIKATDERLVVNGSVMASDAFFPFRDGLDAAYEAGIKAVIQPGGSMRDDEVIAAADEHKIAMVFTGIRHFRH